MKMKMWTDRVARVSKQTNHLTFTNSVADFHANAARLQVGIESVAVLAQVNTYPIAGYRFPCDWHGGLNLSRCLRNILRDAVFNEGDNTIGDGETFSAVAVKQPVCDFIGKGARQNIAFGVNFLNQ
jgi:hypothetical protein